ncbi:putative translation initiation factor IF-2 [Microtus ochrogaster]|uniref:Putative translation initiation factor IF-2 n=1 Tax=Microtus ochrogaster TaxID=79684 RepID=A0A8J6G5W7_MICOH|nr:putative translation initiation factor IF-2 [Microtus ochrogaster]
MLRSVAQAAGTGGSSGEKMEDARVWHWPAGHSWAALSDSDSVPSGVASSSYPQQQSEPRSVTWLFGRPSPSQLPPTN